MFASPVPPTYSPNHPYFNPDPSTSRQPAYSHSHLNAAALGEATSALTLHDRTPEPPAGPAANDGAMTHPQEPAAGKGKAKTKEPPRKRGRKRIEEDLDNIKDNAALDADAKRKLQNRAAQRAFRERKEQHVRDLETRVKEQEQQLDEFRDVICRLLAETEALRRGEQPPPTTVPSSFLEVAQRDGTTASPTPPVSHPSTAPADSPPESKPIVGFSPPAAAHLPPPPAQSYALPPAQPPPQQPMQSYIPPPPFELPAVAPPAPAPYLPPPQPERATYAAPRHPSAPSAAAQPAPLPPASVDLDMSLFDPSTTFDFDAPFDFSDSMALPPLLDSLMTELDASGFFTSSTTAGEGGGPMLPQQSEVDDDACPNSVDDDPPPLPGGRIPCDKAECDFTAVSCQLPIPWRPPPASGNDKDLWVAAKCWAKLVSHPLFGGCNTDELCQLLRDKTRCSDDGRLVCHKNDVCDIFRSIPQRARQRREVEAMR